MGGTGFSFRFSCHLTMGNTFPEFVPELLLHGAEQLPVVAVLESVGPKKLRIGRRAFVVKCL